MKLSRLTIAAPEKVNMAALQEQLTELTGDRAWLTVEFSQDGEAKELLIDYPAEDQPDLDAVRKLAAEHAPDKTDREEFEAKQAETADRDSRLDRLLGLVEGLVTRVEALERNGSRR